MRSEFSGNARYASLNDECDLESIPDEPVMIVDSFCVGPRHQIDTEPGTDGESYIVEYVHPDDAEFLTANEIACVNFQYGASYEGEVFHFAPAEACRDGTAECICRSAAGEDQVPKEFILTSKAYALEEFVEFRLKPRPAEE